MILEEDYDMILWELKQVCTFLRGLGLTDDNINDLVIHGTCSDLIKAYDIVELPYKEK